MALNDAIMIVAFAPLVALLLGLSAITVPWDTLILSVVLYIVVPVLVAQLWRRALLAQWRGGGPGRTLRTLAPLSLSALLLTLVLLFGLQGEQIMRQPVVIALLAVPILIQVYFNAGLAYWLNRRLGVAWCVAGPSALIGASNFFELAVATAIALFGFQSGAALSTVVGVLVEVPVMLSVVQIVRRSRGWYERGAGHEPDALLRTTICRRSIEAHFIAGFLSRARLSRPGRRSHPPRILLLHGSLRARSYSRFLADEAERLLIAMGCETRRFDPAGLPLPDAVDPSHPKVQELRALSLWSEGQVWSSPERHGTLSGIMKCQIDWLPLSEGGVRPTQGPDTGRHAGVRRKPVVQRRERHAPARPLDADGDHPQPVERPQGFRAVRRGGTPAGRAALRAAGGCLRGAGRAFTWLVRDNAVELVDRYSERMETAGKEAAAARSIAEARTG